eukprot:Awhi_evm2s10098
MDLFTLPMIKIFFRRNNITSPLNDLDFMAQKPCAMDLQELLKDDELRPLRRDCSLFAQLKGTVRDFQNISLSVDPNGKRESNLGTLTTATNSASTLAGLLEFNMDTIKKKIDSVKTPDDVYCIENTPTFPEIRGEIQTEQQHPPGASHNKFTPYAHIPLLALGKKKSTSAHTKMGNKCMRSPSAVIFSDEKVDAICATFIEPGGSRELNLSSDTKAMVMDNLKTYKAGEWTKPREEIFAEARYECLRICQLNFFNDFLQEPEITAILLRREKLNGVLMKYGMLLTQKESENIANLDTNGDDPDDHTMNEIDNSINEDREEVNLKVLTSMLEDNADAKKSCQGIFKGFHGYLAAQTK